jgi:hypothetical protein
MDACSPETPVVASVKDAVTRFGGRVAVAERFDVGTTAVGNWCSWNLFPEYLYRRISKAASDAGFVIPDDLFGERSVDKQASARSGQDAA